MSMITKEKEEPIAKKVLLFSGGMDSVMMNYIIKPDINLYINSNSQYDQAQEKALLNLSLYGELHIIRPFDFSFMERDDLIVPSRNAYFLLMAANFGDDLYFGKMLGDRSSDKSPEFMLEMQCLFNLLYAPQHWCEGRRIRIHTPFSGMTKTQVMEQYLNAGGSPHALVASYSCYEGNDHPCGICKPCFRKWVALVNNGFYNSEVSWKELGFENDPAKAPWLEELLPLIKNHQYRGAIEDEEILKALSIAKVHDR